MKAVVSDVLRIELEKMRDQIIDQQLSGVELFDAIDEMINHADANVTVVQPGEVQVADVTIMARMIDAALTPFGQALTVLLERSTDRPRRKTTAVKSAKASAKSSKTRGKRSAQKR